MVTMNEKLGIELSGYKDFPVGEMVDKGSTLQFYLGEPTVDSGASMTLTKADGEKTVWWPWQFHFHAPSEHTVGGQLMDLEIHFVHLPPDYDPEAPFNAAVLGVFFDRSAGGNEPNPFIESLMFQESGESWDVTNVDVKKFLDGLDTKSFMSYEGSLTTPPCTEGVKWTVLLEAQPISDKQLKYYTDRYAGNPDFASGAGTNRITLPLHDRKVYYTGYTGEQSEEGAAALGAAALALVALLNF